MTLWLTEAGMTLIDCAPGFDWGTVKQCRTMLPSTAQAMLMQRHAAQYACKRYKG